MRYLALGDSISIDDYTGVAGGGAVRQLARKIGSEGANLLDLTRDGNTTAGVLAALETVRFQPEVTTCTAGGNDILLGRDGKSTSADIDEIARRLARLPGVVILSTIYDPSDGDDTLAMAHLGMPPEIRYHYRMVNDCIRQAAARHGFLLSDLEALFHGHGLASRDCWYVLAIEPNLAGATAIAEHWHSLLMESVS